MTEKVVGSQKIKKDWFMYAGKPNKHFPWGVFVSRKGILERTGRLISVKKLKSDGWAYCDGRTFKEIIKSQPSVFISPDCKLFTKIPNLVGKKEACK